MTLSIKTLQELASNAAIMAEGAKRMAEKMQTIADDCAEQVAARKASGEDEAAVINETFVPGGTQSAPSMPTQSDAKVSPPITLVELRAFVAGRSTPENRAKIKALLGKYGAAKLTELPEEHYAALKREVEAL